METEQMSQLFQQIGYLTAKVEDTNISVKEIKDALVTFVPTSECEKSHEQIEKMENKVEAHDRYIRAEKTTKKNTVIMVSSITGILMFIADIAVKFLF